MEDIKLLVDTFYEFGPKKKQRMAEEEEARQKAKEAANIAAGLQPNGEPLGVTAGTKKKKTDGDANAATKVNKDANAGTTNKKNNEPQAPEIPSIEDDFPDDMDQNMPQLSLDDVTHALEEFYAERDARRNKMDLMGQTQVKKKSNFEDEEQEAERQKRDERAYWERVTKVLSDRGLSVWKALDKALTKYYGLLVERQNLIEETGLLN